MDNTPAKRRILHGAKAIARYIGDESLSVALRHHSNEWPLFLIGNILCAFETSIDAALLEKEQRGIPPQRPPIQPPRPSIQKPRKSLGSHGEAIFGINRNRLYTMMSDGSLLYVQLGASRLIRTADLHALTTPKAAE
jgi:hypothetical protein